MPSALPMLILSAAGVAAAVALLAREVARLRRRSPDEPLPDDQLVSIAEFDGHLLAEAFAERLQSAGIPALARAGASTPFAGTSVSPWPHAWEVCVLLRDVERARALLP